MLFSKFRVGVAILFATVTGVVPSAMAQGAITTPAEYALIMDYRTGEILYEKNARTPTAPASMSKLMTVAIVFERLKNGSLQLSDEFDVSEKAWREREGSSMWVRVNTSIPVLDLLRGIIVQSGNDACIVVAENISGSEEAFAELMNRKAHEWGLNDSTFANPHGMPHPNQKMSMRDLAILTRKIISEYGEYYALFAEREFTWEKIRQSNRNPILGMVDGADGLKTGHTEESGYGLVGSAVQNNERRIVVVNGLDSERQRATESARLMRVAFNDFSSKKIFEAGSVVGDAQVFKGKDKTVPLITHEPVKLMLHRSMLDDVKAKIIYEGPVSAPISENQQIGTLRVEAENGPAREYALYAGKAVKEASVWGKIGLAAMKLLAKPESTDTAIAGE
ncbi:D-alanyl-D-alanine carboxypeptidase family protein [Hyphococcus sp. DH-69]|uniref:D-alanyl-D-alanine carboxypeptidase family protein n=1 Tax=Hyphococcus formosus TaxID=3143534 RepID=UPI00398AD6E4